jgi:NTP pyrophosphatase (non-canonical NTP hydrolase)
MENELPKENDPKIQEYRQFVYRRECTKEKELKIRLDHSADGLTSESGELKDLMKKIKFYEIQIPKINFLDEMADVLHYLVMGMNALEVTFEDLMRLNMTKLRTRSPNGFTAESATNKDKEKEQEAINKAMDEGGEI